jgi:hypothetical protein
MKRIIFSSALLILLVGITSLAPATKYTYTSDEAGCSVTFPAEFSTTEKDQEDYRSIQTQVVADEMVYMLICTVHNIELTETDDLTEVSMDAFMGSLGGTSKGKTTWKVKKNSGLQSKFEASEEGLYGDYRVLIKGQIQYQIVAVSPTASWNQKKADAFFKSFKLKK